MGNDDHYKYGLEAERDKISPKLTMAIKALEEAKGKFSYIAVQAKLNHSGFHTIAGMNAHVAIKDIEDVLANLSMQEGG